MALFLNETRPMTLYRGWFRFPINKKDRLKGSIVYLMTPNINSTINTLNMKTISSNSLNFQSYFLEKNVMFFINNSLSENGLIIDDEPVDTAGGLLESFNYNNLNDILFEENNLFINSDEQKIRLYFPDYVDSVLQEDLEEYLQEDALTTKYGKYNLTQVFKNMLFKKRMRNQKEIFKHYETIKKNVPYIKFTFVNPALYKNRNVIYDWSYYTNIFFENKLPAGDRALDIFGAFLNRFIKDKRFSNYTHRCIVIPVNDWLGNAAIDPTSYTAKITPMSLIWRSLRTKMDRFSKWGDIDIAFINNNAFFRAKLNDLDPSKDINKFAMLCKKLQTNDTTEAEEIKTDSPDVIVDTLAHKLSNTGIEISDISGDNKKDLEDKGLLKEPTLSDNTEEKKAALVSKLHDIASRTSNVADAEKELYDNENEEESKWLKDLMFDLQTDEGVKINKTRLERHNKLQQELLDKQVGENKKTVGELMKQFATNNEIKESSIPIDSIDDHWKHVKFTNFNETYTKDDMEADIVAVFNHFTNISHPLSILSMNCTNASTSEDYINNWEVKYEDVETGKRFKVSVDIPRMIGNRFMKLRGNEKVLIGQLMLLPIIKTDEDTVQIVSNYNKIFVRRKSPSGYGKSTPIVNKLTKVFGKYSGKEFTVSMGDNSKVCSHYVLPASYIDLACLYNSITFPDGSYISFNMDNLTKLPFNKTNLKGNDSKLADKYLEKKYFGIYVKNGKREPFSLDEISVDQYIVNLMSEKSKDFAEFYAAAPVAKRLMFSEASILSTKIPVILILAYNLGLEKALKAADIDYKYSDKRPSKGESYFKFSDGYLIYYPKSDADNILLNGLMQISTDEYSLREINGKDMWLSVLDDYGGRIKADGFDNFVDLMMDPITKEICHSLSIPDDYYKALLYASSLLVDSKYNRHSDITGNRLRTNEVIVGHLYSVLAKEFGSYRNKLKRNKNSATFSVKRSAVIDSILTHDQTSSDLSTLTPLLEAEAASKVTFKGLSGMNSERAFSMEKRTYDKSMLGVLGLSTGFASTVGINRQTTIDAGVRNKRGFIVPSQTDKLDNLNTFSVMEAMAPLAVNHDDPMRTAMAFTQTVQHQMIVRKSMPNLVTTGADEALPYLTSDKFSYKFKGDKGTIIEVTDDYCLVQDDKTKEIDFIDLRETIQKNSDGGFYVTTKLDLNKGMTKGKKVKQNDIIAYNKKSYSNAIGNGNGKDPNGISYNIGTMAKIAILNTAMGFEDSCVVDSTLSKALSVEYVVQKEVNLDATANLFSIVKKGDPIQEGQPLLIFSDALEDEDVSAVVRKLQKDTKIFSDIGRKQVHAKITGVIQDIKVYRTVDLDKLSPTLKSFVTKHEANINKLKSIMKKNSIDKEYTLEPTYKLPKEGKLKSVDGIRIEFYIKTVDHYAAGDKLTFYQGLKGVCSSIIPEGSEAFSDYRPEEYVNGFLTSTGAFGRMVTSCMTIGLLNKGLLELSRQCQEKLGIKPRNLQEILLSED